MMTAGIKPRNLMEELVNDRLDEYMQSLSNCCCDYCRADIMALSLNNLQPKYVVTVNGEVYTRYDSVKVQAQADVITSILSAITIINKNPRHDVGHQAASSQ